jgi:hypothetical protein
MHQSFIVWPVNSERDARVMFGLRDDHVPTRRPRVACDTLRAIPNLHIAITVTNPDLFAGIFRALG